MTGQYASFLDAVAAGDGYYLTCSNGHGLVPPRRACPHCGDRELERTPLPDTGEIETYSTVTVPTPAYEDEAPYVTAIASFGQVRLTGLILDADPGSVAIGRPVTVDVAEPNDERTIVFHPQ